MDNLKEKLTPDLIDEVMHQFTEDKYPGSPQQELVKHLGAVAQDSDMFLSFLLSLQGLGPLSTALACLSLGFCLSQTLMKKEAS